MEPPFSMGLYRLFYISTVTPFFSEKNLTALCANAAEFNKKHEIGGALVYNGINFAQVLEGEQDVVLELLERIKKDARHSGLIVLREMPVKKRYYDDWGMRLMERFDFSQLQKSMQEPE